MGRDREERPVSHATSYHSAGATYFRHGARLTTQRAQHLDARESATRRRSPGWNRMGSHFTREATAPVLCQPC